VVKPEGHGTSNAGIFGGKKGNAAGDATNVVTDYVHIVGAARSPDVTFAAKIAAAYCEASAKAQAEVKNADGETAEMTFTSKPSYPSFKLREAEPVIQHAKRVVESLGLKPTTVFSNGGLDANWLVNHGVPTVTLPGETVTIPPPIPLLPGKPMSNSQSPEVSYKPAVVITASA
jgi:tripeptide aminopeptidase